MVALITIIILLSCVVLAFFILVQNPKGGGLSGSFGSISSQVMGVKQSTDVMEKGTWTCIGIIGGLCVISIMFFEKPKSFDKNGGKAQSSQSAPKQSAPKTK
ncbi:MAG: preprotein translocase subunit SecG [Taibaiella sp.]|nr:preprotein translocase subunit SecG [Taibaiella sp.]